MVCTTDFLGRGDWAGSQVPVTAGARHDGLMGTARAAVDLV
jgi:hypothetical protein